MGHPARDDNLIGTLTWAVEDAGGPTGQSALLFRFLETAAVPVAWTELRPFQMRSTDPGLAQPKGEPGAPADRFALGYGGRQAVMTK
jgi:hypothetical protein